MGKVLLCAENLLNATYFPGGTALAANEEPAGFEAVKIARGSRSLLNKWTMSTAATEGRVTRVFDQVRSFDFLYLYNHNLGGKTLKLWVTSDATDFTGTYEEIFNITVPNATASLPADNTNGVKTEDGAFLIRFPLRVGKAVRFVIPSLGAGLKPEIGYGLLGLSWSAEFPSDPHHDSDTELITELEQTDAGWRGAGRVAAPRQGSLTLELSSFWAYDLARYHLEGHFALRRPMVLIQDDEQADRAVLAVRPPGRAGFRFTPDWPYRSGVVEWEELEAKPI